MMVMPTTHMYMGHNLTRLSLVYDCFLKFELSAQSRLCANIHCIQSSAKQQSPDIMKIAGCVPHEGTSRMHMAGFEVQNPVFEKVGYFLSQLLSSELSHFHRSELIVSIIRPSNSGPDVLCSMTIVEFRKIHDLVSFQGDRFIFIVLYPFKRVSMIEIEPSER